MFSKRSTECKITDDAQMLDEERIPIAIGHMSDSVFLIKNVMGAFFKKGKFRQFTFVNIQQKAINFSKSLQTNREILVPKYDI